MESEIVAKPQFATRATGSVLAPDIYDWTCPKKKIEKNCLTLSCQSVTFLRMLTQSQTRGFVMSTNMGVFVLDSTLGGRWA